MNKCVHSFLRKEEAIGRIYGEVMMGTYLL